MSTVTEVYRPVNSSFLSEINRDRRDGHRFFMSCLRNPTLSPESPRKDAGLLWDVDPEKQLFIVRRNSSTLFEPEARKIEFASEIAIVPNNLTAEDSVLIEGKVARQYSPLIKRDPEVEKFLQASGTQAPKRPRSRLQPVPSENLNSWLTEKLERLDLTVQELDAHVIPDIRLSKMRKRESVPAARFQARVSGSPEAMYALLEKGFGRAKNFGLGLIQIHQDS